MSDKAEIQFTSIYGGSVYVNPDDVTAYRANTGYTMIYMDGGDILYVTESFEYVDSLLKDETE